LIVLLSTGMACRKIWLAAGALCLVLVSIGTPAWAHLSLERGGTHKSRYGDTVIKAGPCGRAGGTRGTNVYEYAPGERITVKLVEYIPHPGYFRFAFDADGDNDFKPPASIKPVDPARKCPINVADKCGTSDFYNSPTVLPGMDNLEPHLKSPDPVTYTFQVTLPNVECNNCTLQVIQVMEDKGAYNTDPNDPTDTSAADLYYQCIDLVLKRLSSDAGADSSTTRDAAVQPDAALGLDAGTGLDGSPERDASVSTPDASPGAAPSSSDGGCECAFGRRPVDHPQHGTLALFGAALGYFALRMRIGPRSRKRTRSTV
jgi:hypothetical protein